MAATGLAFSAGKQAVGDKPPSLHPLHHYVVTLSVQAADEKILPLAHHDVVMGETAHPVAQNKLTVN